MNNNRLKKIRFEKIELSSAQAEAFLRIWSDFLKERRPTNKQEKISWWIITEFCMMILQKDFSKPKKLKINKATIYALDLFLKHFDWTDLQDSLEYAAISKLAGDVDRSAVNTDYEIDLLVQGRYR